MLGVVEVSISNPEVGRGPDFENAACGVNLDMAPDGKRFAVFPAPDATKGSVHVTFLLNFVDELLRRIPAGN